MFKKTFNTKVNTNKLKKPTITLHLGVHKTATTHIQSRLHHSIDTLNNHKIGYISLAKLRKTITTKLNKKISVSSIRKSLQPFMSYDHLIISDENILGTSLPSYNKIYPDTVPRLKKILHIFEGHQIKIHITLRSYTSFLISRYAEVLRHREFIEFETYYNKIDFNTVSWLDLLDQFKKAGFTDITVTPFETLFHNEQEYLEMLVDQKGIMFNTASDTAQTRRSKFSQEGYNVIKFYAQHYSSENTKDLTRFIDKHTQKTPVTQFMPFTQAQQEKLLTRYNKDMRMILKDNINI